MCSTFLLAVGGNVYYCNTILSNTCFPHMCPCILLVLDFCKTEILFKVWVLDLFLFLGIRIIQANTLAVSDTSTSVFCGSSLCLPEEHQKYIPKRLVCGSGVWIIQRGLVWQHGIVLNCVMTNSSLPAGHGCLPMWEELLLESCHLPVLKPNLETWWERHMIFCET